MKQVKVSLPDFAANHLSAAADRERRSLSEEIRERITQSVQQDSLAPETIGLLDSVTALVTLVEKQTGHAWYAHPAAIRVLGEAIVARLDRCRDGVRDAVFTLDELPEDRIVGSADQRTWGAALEAVDVYAFEQDRRGTAALPRYEPATGYRGYLRDLAVMAARAGLGDSDLPENEGRENEEAVPAAPRTELEGH